MKYEVIKQCFDLQDKSAGRLSPDKPPFKNAYGDILQIYKQLILFERQNFGHGGSPSRIKDKEAACTSEVLGVVLPDKVKEKEVFRSIDCKSLQTIEIKNQKPLSTDTHDLKDTTNVQELVSKTQEQTLDKASEVALSSVQQGNYSLFREQLKREDSKKESN